MVNEVRWMDLARSRKQTLEKIQSAGVTRIIKSSGTIGYFISVEEFEKYEQLKKGDK